MQKVGPDRAYVKIDFLYNPTLLIVILALQKEDR